MTSPWEHEPRERLTDQQRAKLFMERDGKCHRCGTKVRGKKWYDEHVIALENGGTNKWDNRDITCYLCFHPKNTEDHGKAAKSRAVATKHVIPRSQRKDRTPLPGSRGHWSKRRKRMNGKVDWW